ncbi:glycosyl hydrolase [Streptomyces boninensis]|uniref:glycosyl hydrolase n=1 Tax=Streptomyces boninensis TaxID=2039455 RepID=UPI003B220E24
MTFPSLRTRLVLIAAVLLLVVPALLALLAGGDDGSDDDRGPQPTSAECRPTKLLAPPCGAWFGAFVPHAKTDLAEKVAAYEKDMGRRLDIVYTYHDMSTRDLEGQLLTEQEQQVGEDRMLLLSWESKDWGANGGKKHKWIKWRDIAAGKLDRTVIDPQAKRVAEYGERTGKKIFLSFDLEMDTRMKNGSAKEFRDAWQHIYQRFEAAGADNVIWTWIITGYLEHADRFTELYPGHQFVDWVGYNKYNYYRCHKTGWESFADLQLPVYRWITENISDKKPLMLSEYGSAQDTRDPGRQADWYADVPEVMKRMPQVKAALQWNSRDPGPHCDLSLQNGEAVAALKKAGQDTYFRQPVP